MSTDGTQFPTALDGAVYGNGDGQAATRASGLLVKTKGVALGAGAAALAEGSLAIGAAPNRADASGFDASYKAAVANAANAAQIGAGTNAVAGTIQYRDKMLVPISFGTAAPTGVIPTIKGELYLDTTNKRLYIAKAITADTDWVDVMADEAGT